MEKLLRGLAAANIYDLCSKRTKEQKVQTIRSNVWIWTETAETIYFTGKNFAYLFQPLGVQRQG